MANMQRRMRLLKRVKGKEGTESGKTSYQVSGPARQDPEHKDILRLTLSETQLLSGCILHVRSRCSGTYSVMPAQVSYGR